MLRARNRILLGVVLLSVSSITMAGALHEGQATRAIQLFLIALAPAEAPQVVNVNIHDAATMETNLLGVGPHRARAIVSYRERHGDFESLLDLLKVEGLDRQLIVRNKNLIEF